MKFWKLALTCTSKNPNLAEKFTSLAENILKSWPKQSEKIKKNPGFFLGPAILHPLLVKVFKSETISFHYTHMDKST